MIPLVMKRLALGLALAALLLGAGCSSSKVAVVHTATMPHVEQKAPPAPPPNIPLPTPVQPK
jgi:hypothetical protein